MALLPGQHLGDFTLLVGDDGAREAAQSGVFAVLQFHPRRIHRTLVMRDHARDKILIGVAAEWALHVLHHGFVCGLKGLGGRTGGWRHWGLSVSRVAESQKKAC